MDNRVDHANPFTNQIFQEAVIRNDMAIVKLLLKYGIYPKRSERNRQGLTALQQSVLDGNGRMTILLLESGADIESKTSNGWTCLHIASALGDLDMLTTLVNHCCDLVALTKNEELPIDLAASRDIKIKLAKEMSRIGYSELAQWYMRKLAAREGVFYVISTDTLLDLACDDKQERNYSDDYSYYARQYRNQQREMYIHSPVRKQQESPNLYRVNASPKKDFWLENSTQEQTKYLTFSSGYLSEVIFDPASGQYSKALATSVLESPQRKQPVVEEKVPLASISEVDGPPLSQGNASATTPVEETKSRSGTLKRTPSNKRHSQNMSRKQSTIEMYIDYSHTTESDSDGDDDEDEDEDVGNNGDDCAFTSDNLHEDQQEVILQSNPHRGVYQKSSPSNHHHKGASPSYERASGFNKTSSDRFESLEEYGSNSTGTLIVKDTSSSGTRMAVGESSSGGQFQDYSADAYGTTPNNNTSTWSSSGSGGNKSRNVKFDPDDKNNEFCNCPTCKKLGYAFSPDIQVDSRKPFHSKASGSSSSDVLQPMIGFNQFYYPETTTEKGALYYDQGGYPADYKQRKRKKKLFSGIKSMFKDSIKVRTNMEPSPACDDAGILFSVSVRDRNKAKQIRQRQGVRRSNSFSGIENTYRDGTVSSRNHGEEEVNVLPHSQVVAPPPKFSDIYYQNPDNYNDSKMESVAKSYERYQHQQQRQHQTGPHYLTQSQLQQQQQNTSSSGYPPHHTSRNTYERRDRLQQQQQQQSSNGNMIADDSYTEEEINAYYDASTTQNGFQYSRGAQSTSYYPTAPIAHHQPPQTDYPSLQQQHNHQPKYRNNIPTNDNQPSLPSSAFEKVNKLTDGSVALSKMTGIETIHREGDKMMKLVPNARQELSADNCEFCKTSAPVAGAIPLAAAIE